MQTGKRNEFGSTTHAGHTLAGVARGLTRLMVPNAPHLYKLKICPIVFIMTPLGLAAGNWSRYTFGPK